MNRTTLNAVGVGLASGLLFAGIVAFAGTDAGASADLNMNAPAFSATGTDGKTYTLQSFLEKGPVVLYFIKEGCPVNHRAAPYVTKLTGAYGEKANVVGIYNGDVSSARAWAKEYKAEYTILADPQYKVIRSYKAHYSPWLVAVGKDSKITNVFEGASPASLAKVNSLVASAAGMKLASIDFSGAPSGGG